MVLAVPMSPLGHKNITTRSRFNHNLLTHEDAHLAYQSALVLAKTLDNSLPIPINQLTTQLPGHNLVTMHCMLEPSW